MYLALESAAEGVESPDIIQVKQLREYIEILFYFEKLRYLKKKDTEGEKHHLVQFYTCVRAWLSHLVCNILLSMHCYANLFYMYRSQRCCVVLPMVTMHLFLLISYHAPMPVNGLRILFSFLLEIIGKDNRVVGGRGGGDPRT